MIELSNEERTLIVNVLNQAHVIVSEAKMVLDLIEKLKVTEEPSVKANPAG